MRALLVGAHVPFSHASAVDALGAHRALVAEGYTVSVLTPREGSVGHFEDLRGPAGVLRMLRRSVGRNKTVICVDREMLFSFRRHRWSRLLEAQFLRYAFRLAKVSQVRIMDSRLMDVPIGTKSFRMVWDVVPSIVVASPGDRATLIIDGHCPEEKVALVGRFGDEKLQARDEFVDRSEAEVPAATAIVDYSSLSEGTLQEVQAQIRVRAAAKRHDQ